MTQDPYNAPTLRPEKPKGRNTGLLVVIGLLVLLCLCIAGALLMYYVVGDPLTEMLGISF